MLGDILSDFEVLICPHAAGVDRSHHTYNAFGAARFRNPWKSAKPLTVADISTAVRKGAEIDADAPDKPALGLSSPEVSTLSESKAGVMFIGHASVLLQLPWGGSGGTNGHLGVLFDPVFSKRCSPSQRFGPKRFVAAPLTVAELPPIHICCISHDHYDHLDANTIKDLWLFHNQSVKFFVPLGVKQWFIDLNLTGLASSVVSSTVTEIVENSPWISEKNSLDSLTLLSAPDGAARVKIACTPAQHRSGRGLTDQWKTLWCSWVVQTLDFPDLRGSAANSVTQTAVRQRYFFGGFSDTGLRYAGGTKRESEECPAFAAIASTYGPFDLALLPISTGSSLSFLRQVFKLSLNQHALTSSIHCSARDAIRLHQILGSKQSIGIHWGTFSPADEAHGTLRALREQRAAAGVAAEWGQLGAFTTQDVGKVLAVPGFDQGIDQVLHEE